MIKMKQFYSNQHFVSLRILHYQIYLQCNSTSLPQLPNSTVQLKWWQFRIKRGATIGPETLKKSWIEPGDMIVLLELLDCYANKVIIRWKSLDWRLSTKLFWLGTLPFSKKVLSLASLAHNSKKEWVPSSTVNWM